MCLSVQTITFEPLHIGTSFLVWWYILTISRSSLSIKVIGSRSRSCTKKWLFTYFNLLFLCMYLQTINKSRSHIKVKVTHQGQGQIKVNIKFRSFLRRDTLTRVVCIWIKCVLVYIWWGQCMAFLWTSERGIFFFYPKWSPNFLPLHTSLPSDRCPIHCCLDLPAPTTLLHPNCLFDCLVLVSYYRQQYGRFITIALNRPLVLSSVRYAHCSYNFVLQPKLR